MTESDGSTNIPHDQEYNQWTRSRYNRETGVQLDAVAATDFAVKQA